MGDGYSALSPIQEYVEVELNMKQSTLRGLTLFSAGLLAGHYHVADIIRDFMMTEERLGSESIGDVSENKPLSSNVTLKTKRSTPREQKSFNVQVAAKENSAIQGDPELLPHPYPFELTAEEQAQLASQRREAMEAQIHQIEAMILSMKENGLPAGDIAAFGEMKKAMEDQLVAESENQETNTPGDIDSDFAASLEQMGLSPAERDKMLGGILSPRDSANEGGGDAGIEPLPPYAQ